MADLKFGGYEPTCRRRPSPGRVKGGARLVEFHGEALRLGANGDESEEGVGVGADDGEVRRGFVSDEQYAGFVVGARKVEAHGRGSGAYIDWLGDAAIDDVHGKDVARGTIGDVHFGGIFGEESTGRGVTDQKRIAHFMRPGIDGLQNVSFR